MDETWLERFSPAHGLSAKMRVLFEQSAARHATLWKSYADGVKLATWVHEQNYMAAKAGLFPRSNDEEPDADPSGK